MLRKGVYPCKCMDSWKRFDETSLPDKEDFYSNLNIEDITDADHEQAKKGMEKSRWVSWSLSSKWFIIQSGTLLLADVFENFRNKCTEIYKLDPTHFLSASGFAWQACLLRIVFGKKSLFFRKFCVLQKSFPSFFYREFDFFQ